MITRRGATFVASLTFALSLSSGPAYAQDLPGEDNPEQSETDAPTDLSGSLGESQSSAQVESEEEVDDSDLPQQEAYSCRGSAGGRPGLSINDRGVRFMTGNPSQNCEANEPFTQELCAKFQRYTGGPSGSWVNVTTWRCSRNTGPSIHTPLTVGCDQLDRTTTYRTGARGTIYPTRSPSQRRYRYSGGSSPC